ncbi:hypothetical protein Cni_G10028 [Canna indica]|uniref:Uncharacterized protein n=1 Tax=Canna indica TaxID=4628 RepID=A0AAQ3K3M0_9LILI|nr:hypothetical protein Cni_G10028 [Canna indica]
MARKTITTTKADKKKQRNSALSKTLNAKISKNMSKKKNLKSKNKGEREERRRRTGPRLPSAMRKELEHLNRGDSDSESEEFRKDDVYEYEEDAPEEESRKNRRYDSVENYEYELPEEFEDEDVPSDEGEDDGIRSDGSDDGQEGDRHTRMLEGITGLPGEAFEGKERKKFVASDFQGESSDGRISIHDLLDPLHGKPGYSSLRKRLTQLEKKPMTVQAPLPKVEREKLERKVAYEHSKKDMTQWEPLVKRNREAPTLYFGEDVNLGYSTVGAIAAEFEPRTEFEKKMALLVRDPEVVEAHKKDGARLLELNKISIEDQKDRQNQLAKMRSLLFRHEMKAKHIKKIKSKTYHRILKRERLKAPSAEVEMDLEAAKEIAMKQEFKRAEERMTLKHKNRSKWAKRILKRGLTVQDEGTRAAIAEQLNQHALLTRKMNSIKDTSSSDESSDDDDSADDELSPGMKKERALKLINKAKENTLKALEDGDELPKSGVFALPFMERGLKKRQVAIEEEARLALQEYDASLGQLETGDDVESPKSVKVSGRKVFGPPKDKPQQSSKRMESYNVGRSSDSEDDFVSSDHADDGQEVNNHSQELHLGAAFHDDSENAHQSLFNSFDDIVKEPGPKTTYEVAIFASDSWKKMKDENVVDDGNMKVVAVQNVEKLGQGGKSEEVDQDSGDDSEEKMVDGFLSSSSKHDNELLSQADLLHSAFAGDDVEAEFEKDKMEILDEENPEPEKPVLIPGWGQWTHIQQKKGLPSWMLKEHENAKRKRDEALQKRKDANLKHLIISEKIDKKAEKLLVKSLPFPYTSKEVYEQSIRMPIGPEYNPAITAGALTRPMIVKKAGVIIKPIQYEEVDAHEKPDQPKHIVHKSNTKPKAKKAKTGGGKHVKKAPVMRSS